MLSGNGVAADIEFGRCLYFNLGISKSQYFPSSVTLEVLHGAFVSFGFLPRRESAQIAALAGLRILLT